MLITIDKIKDTTKVKMDCSDLVESIRRLGLVRPLCVKPVNGKFVIVDGARRYQACKELGMLEIDCVIVDFELECTLPQPRVKNNAIESAKMIERILRSKQVKIAEIARVCNKSKRWIKNMLRLLQLSEATQGLIGTLLIGTEPTIPILVQSLVPVEKWDEAVTHVVTNKYNLRQTMDYINKEYNNNASVSRRSSNQREIRESNETTHGTG